MPRNRWASVATTRFAVILEWNRMLTMHISSWIVRTAAFTTSITLPQKTTLKRFCIAFDQLSVSSNFTAKWLLNSWIPLFAVACFFLFHFFVLLFCGYQYNGDGLFTLNGAVKSFFLLLFIRFFFFLFSFRSFDVQKRVCMCFCSETICEITFISNCLVCDVLVFELFKQYGTYAI